MARSPKQVGAVWPSSPALGRAMARFLPADSDAPILELGPGTGIVTSELLKSGLPPRRLVAVEKSEKMAQHLQHLFPGTRIIAGDALDLDGLFPDEHFAAVISSLPLKVFSPQQVETLASQIERRLLPGAHWVQFSYHIVNGVPPSKSFSKVDSHIVWSNFPPAKVSVYRPLHGPIPSA